VTAGKEVLSSPMFKGSREARRIANRDTRAPAALPSDKKIGLANGGQNALLSAKSTACFA